MNNALEAWFKGQEVGWDGDVEKFPHLSPNRDRKGEKKRNKYNPKEKKNLLIDLFSK